MTRTLSTAVYRALLARESTDGPVLLITITTGIGTPVRVCSGGADIVSRGNTFIAYPFNIAPVTDGDAAPRASLLIGNVDRRITDALDKLTKPPTFKLEAVLFSDPQTVWYAVDGLKLKTYTADSITVTGELSLERFTSEPWPGVFMTPSFAPTLYA